MVPMSYKDKNIIKNAYITTILLLLCVIETLRLEKFVL